MESKWPFVGLVGQMDWGEDLPVFPRHCKGDTQCQGPPAAGAGLSREVGSTGLPLHD